MRFIHTADLHIGARFAQFGEEAEVLRQARVQALDRVLDYLQQIPAALQILALTCHSSMYRGVGHAVNLDVGAAS